MIGGGDAEQRAVLDRGQDTVGKGLAPRRQKGGIAAEAQRIGKPEQRAEGKPPQSLGRLDLVRGERSDLDRHAPVIAPLRRRVACQAEAAIAAQAEWSRSCDPSGLGAARRAKRQAWAQTSLCAAAARQNFVIKSAYSRIIATLQDALHRPRETLLAEKEALP